MYIIILLKSQMRETQAEIDKTFSDIWRESDRSINAMIKRSNELAKQQVLKDKIDSYYQKLEIDTLIENYEESMKQFKIAKYKLSSIFGNVAPTAMCQICLDNQVEYFLDPCGHTLCGSCKVSCESKTHCHYCRTKRNNFKKLYF